MSSRPSMSVQNLVLESESVNDESWMTSYIDVFVLMTSIFVVLFMMNKPQHQVQELAVKTLTKTVEPIINLSDKALLDLVQPFY